MPGNACTLVYSEGDGIVLDARRLTPSPPTRTVIAAMDHPYLHLDVFTSTPLSGNQLAVFLEPPTWPDETMQAVAREMNFSETTFVYPPAHPGSLARVRIFTPGAELPMAGHPTIGTTFALALKERVPPGTGHIVLDLGVGPTRVDLEWEAKDLRFAWMTQPRPTFGPVFENRDEVARALGLERTDLVSDLPIEIVSCGVPFLYLPIVSSQAVDRARMDRTAWQGACAANSVEEQKLFLFSIEDNPAAPRRLYSRMLADVVGIAEDPGTGGASGPLGSYLVRHGVARGPVCDFLSHQGVAMRRPCEISIRIASEGPDIARVQIGGTAVRVGEAWLRF